MIRNHIIASQEDPESSWRSSDSSVESPAGKDLNYFDQNSEDLWFNAGRESPLNGSAENFTFKAPSSGNGSTISHNTYVEEEDYANEPPLLEELGIRFDHIWTKTQAVININKSISMTILDDADLAGPMFFCLLLGSFLLLSGKVHFGYIYGFSVGGCLGMHAILNLMNKTGIDFWRTCSVLGYCLLPVIVLAGFSIVLSLKGVLGLILSAIVIAWSTYAATRLFDAKLELTEQYWLVVYPIVLLYSCFVIITIL